MSRVTLDYNSITWSYYFKLSEESPSGLVWKVAPSRNIRTKDIAGCKNSKAWNVRLNGVLYKVHRVIWVLYHGSISKSLIIDHLDGNPHNNKIDNLALKTIRHNQQNQKKRCTNTSGVTGVYVSIGSRERWVAEWQDKDSVKNVKLFSIKQHGYEQAKALAIAYRKEQIELLNNQGQDYTERHIQNET